MPTGDVTLTFTIKDHPYAVRLNDFTGEDDQLLYQKTGFTLLDVFVGGRITLFTIAGLAWLSRRRLEPKLDYETVNKEIDFAALETFKEQESEVPAGPEA